MEAVADWAERRNIAFSGYTDLAQQDPVYELVAQCLEQVNADLAREPELANSQIHRFLILHKELEADDGELTRTRKVRRGFIAETYGSLVEAMFQGRNSVHVEAQVKYEHGRSATFAAERKIRDAKTFVPAAARRAACAAAAASAMRSPRSSARRWPAAASARC